MLYNITHVKNRLIKFFILYTKIKYYKNLRIKFWLINKIINLNLNVNFALGQIGHALNTTCEFSPSKKWSFQQDFDQRHPSIPKK